jgi:diguanylate cyclase (GGDEF)-like protein/PAS domain S-box-containing protein
LATHRAEQAGRNLVTHNTSGDEFGSAGAISAEVATIVLRATQALILVLDAAGRIVLFNPACEDSTGYPASEVLGEKMWRYLHRADAGAAREAFEELARTPIPTEHESRWRAKGEGLHSIAWSYRALVDDDGVLTHAVVTGIDVTDQRLAEEALAGREAELASMMASLPIGHWSATWDSESGEVIITRTNTRGDEIVGAALSESEGVPLTKYVHPDDVESVTTAIAEVIGQKIEAERTVRIVRPDGEIRWVRSRGAPVIDAEGDVVGGVGWLMDITAEVEAVDEAEHLSQIVDAATDLVLMLTPTGAVRYANPATESVLGSRPGHVRDLLDDHSATLFAHDVLVALENKGEWRGEMTIVTGAGDRLPVSQLFLAHSGPGGGVDRLSMLARDISESKQLEEHLSHMAFHDALTGLPNRALVLDRLTQALDRATRSASHVAVMFLDLDYFKSVNDQFGHEAGDELLRLTAGRLNAAVRPGDTVSRMGGDEFVIICESVADTSEALRIAERVRATMDREFTLGGSQVHSSASIGIAMAKDGSSDPTELLTQADTAAYLAKERGRNRYEQYLG